MKLFRQLAKRHFLKKLLKSSIKRLKEFQIVLQTVLDEGQKTAETILDARVLDLKAVAQIESEEKIEPIILTDEIKKFLKNSKFSEIDISISFIMPSRAKNNPTFAPSKLLDSYLINCSNAGKSEFIIVIDEDDDIEKFIDLKQAYADKLPLKIIISKERYSYYNFHKYWKIAFKHMSPYSKMFCSCSDDIVIDKIGFDDELMKIDQKFGDNVYIIHTMQLDRKKLFGRNYQSNIEIHNDYKTLFHVFATDGIPTSYYPFVSRAFYEEGKKLQDSGLVGDDWVYILNCYSSDWYASILGDFISELGLEKRVTYFDNFIVRDITTISDHHVKYDEYGFREYMYLFQTVFARSTINHLRLIAKNIKNLVSSSDL